MTPDLIHDYDYNLRNALSRLNGDPALRPEDRRLVLAFLEHIKALRVSTGRQAKYANMLRTASHMLRVPWRRAKEEDIVQSKEPMQKLPEGATLLCGILTVRSRGDWRGWRGSRRSR